MLIQEHIQTALDFLQAADSEFATGDTLQASEKLWGAASHAVMAFAQQRGWPFGKHAHIKAAADRLASEYDDPSLTSGFTVAQQFHANFYHDFMEEDDLDRARPIVRDYIERLIEIYNDTLPVS